MRFLREAAGILGYAAIVLVLYRVLPEWLVSEERYLNSIIIYVVISVVFFVIIYLKGLDSLEYFRLPRKSVASITAMVIAAAYASPEFLFGGFKKLSWDMAVLGIIFLLGIGISEELFSRGLVFGMLRKYGERRAMIFSSVVFGLFHINVYVGENWDVWAAYNHVISAGSWGFLACAVMIATRSIWFTALFHALVDWNIVFAQDIDYSDAGPLPVYSLWDNLVTPWVDLIFYVPMALLILRVNRGGWPKWMGKIALKWKLVVPVSF
ncbi:unannotated protein [freshwater metagenome]|uniref:Unannotated protein n=1 Tax=freshwater metagenome TaxID=449393 RepID=A0A6J7H268_9ZZZZ